MRRAVASATEAPGPAAQVLLGALPVGCVGPAPLRGDAVTVDAERLRRAVHLPDPVRRDDFTWAVGPEHIVSPLAAPGERCTCSDCRFRPGVQCKHQLSVQLLEALGADLLAALRQLVAVPRP
jgi:hypothetical protein